MIIFNIFLIFSFFSKVEATAAAHNQLKMNFLPVSTAARVFYVKYSLGCSKLKNVQISEAPGEQATKT